MLNIVSQSNLCTCFRYVLKVTINRGYAGSVVEYQEFVVWLLFDSQSNVSPLSDSVFTFKKNKIGWTGNVNVGHVMKLLQ